MISSIELIKFFNTKKDDECTFHPKINKSSRPFSLEKDNKNPPRCVETVKNSTKNKEFNNEKSKKIISSNINLKIDNNFSVREASHKVSKDQYISNEKESRNCNKFNSKLNLGFIKSSLRNELHSIKFNDEYNF